MNLADPGQRLPELKRVAVASLSLSECEKHVFPSLPVQSLCFSWKPTPCRTTEHIPPGLTQS